MSNNQTPDSIVKFIKEGDGDNVFIFSPIYPFNYKLFKNLFLKLNLSNYQFIFSSIIINKNNKNDLFDYNNLMNLYIKVIKLILPKRVNLIGFGLFSNLFIEVASSLKDRIKTLTLFEPDFSDVIFSKIFDSKKTPLFKVKYILKSFFEDASYKKINKKYLSKIKLEYLKYYFKSIKKNNKDYHLKELIDYVPSEINEDIFNEKILSKIKTKKDKLFILKYFIKDKNKYILKITNLPEQEKIKLKQILIDSDLLVNLSIFWKIMSKDSWPLAQVFEDYKISVNLMNYDVFKSLNENNNLLGVLKKIYQYHN